MVENISYAINKLSEEIPKNKPIRLKKEIPIEDIELTNYLLSGKYPKTPTGRLLLEKLLAMDDS